MKKKFNPELLKEELKKFKLLSEYDFYQEKKDLPEYKDLIVGDEEISEADDEPADLKPEKDVDQAANKVADELGVDAESPEGSDDTETSGDIPEPEMDEPEQDMATQEPAPVQEPATDDVEVDVTSLVKGSEEAKNAADSANHTSQMLLKKLSDLEGRLAKMTSITAKIQDLEKEIIKRNPTPVEKLEMRSLDSYPFNQKLTDYWSEKEGAYDVMNKSNKPKEYVLTKDEVNHGYSDSMIKKSFNPDDNPYGEEDISNFEEDDIY